MLSSHSRNRGYFGAALILYGYYADLFSVYQFYKSLFASSIFEAGHFSLRYQPSKREPFTAALFSIPLARTRILL